MISIMAMRKIEIIGLFFYGSILGAAIVFILFSSAEPTMLYTFIGYGLLIVFIIITCLILRRKFP